ncbi:NADP-dependent malic enzyme [Dissulfuribacter thermophilus]|uniref:NADP-dependent malic enzyme n=1 Tax=Dissulfuribacter thermophilus TaxID=1156395 RepID=A0A1B9F5D8_9BACT|nr:NADP-dependent malic enzyme [Dissulfuribacter thermophilus]OCC15157.1 NADP-dependent malic enzyme [Dissulfuribacter thermophilus]
MDQIYNDALDLHRKLRGKIEVRAKAEIKNLRDLSLLYSPGVAAPCRAIKRDLEEVWNYTIKANTVGIVTDGSAVLGLGDIGPEASLPVMEGKAMLFKRFANIDAFPICLATKDPEEIVETVRRICPVFGGINLEDIAAPRCFLVEEALQDLGIPVFHDDQHGTAIVVLAALMNAVKCLGKSLEDLKVVICGAGAAGIAIARLLRCVGHEGTSCITVKEVICVDSKGIIHRDREDLNRPKEEILMYTNPRNIKGGLEEALSGADCFIGVSKGNILDKSLISKMNHDPIVFALANPDPEINPKDALEAGAAIVATGRSDFPNQVNNVLGFPGIFRGALDARAKRITNEMKLAASKAIAACVEDPTPDRIIPSVLNEDIVKMVSIAVFRAANMGDLTE